MPAEVTAQLPVGDAGLAGEVALADAVATDDALANVGIVLDLAGHRLVVLVRRVVRRGGCRGGHRWSLRADRAELRAERV